MTEPTTARPIKLLDTTLRDGQQSLWATRMTTETAAAVAHLIAGSGFSTVDVLAGAHADVMVRFLGENPWHRMQILKQILGDVPMMTIIRGRSLTLFDVVPDDILNLWIDCAAAAGTDEFAVFDGFNDVTVYEPTIRRAHEHGRKVRTMLTFTESPVHSDEYFVAKAKEMVAAGCDMLMFKDPGGVLSMERARQLLPKIRAACPVTVDLELHSHASSGWSQHTYLLAAELGFDTLHTCIAPLAEGNALPSVEQTVHNLAEIGIATPVDLESVRAASRTLAAVARRTGLPVGAPAALDLRVYGHQMPGGALSNIVSSLDRLDLSHRFEEVLEECANVRADFGFPIMVTPFPQFVATQAVSNIVTGRYRVIPDSVKKYVLGWYGKPLGELSDQLVEAVGKSGDLPERSEPEPALPKLRKKFVGASDEELLLRYLFAPGLVEPVMSRPRPDHLLDKREDFGHETQVGQIESVLRAIGDGPSSGAVQIASDSFRVDARIGPR
jgi:oxaloacetate decarboxylase alpha subunit